MTELLTIIITAILSIAVTACLACGCQSWELEEIRRLNKLAKLLVKEGQEKDGEVCRLRRDCDDLRFQLETYRNTMRLQELIDKRIRETEKTRKENDQG